MCLDIQHYHAVCLPKRRIMYSSIAFTCPSYPFLNILLYSFVCHSIPLQAAADVQGSWWAFLKFSLVFHTEISLSILQILFSMPLYAFLNLTSIFLCLLSASPSRKSPESCSWHQGRSSSEGSWSCIGSQSKRKRLRTWPRSMSFLRRSADLSLCLFLCIC